MELLRYWKVIQKSWWLILLLVAVTVGSTAFYTLSQPLEYESSATLILNPALPSELISYYQNSAASNLADSYSELLRTQSFAQSVVQRLPFPLAPEAVIHAIDTQLVPNTLFYKISVRLDTPARAQQLVSTVVEVFLTASTARRSPTSDDPSADPKSEAQQQLEAKLTDLAARIKSYDDAIARLELEPPSKDRDDQLSPLYNRVATLEQTQTEALVALLGVARDNTPVSAATVLDPAQPGKPVPQKIAANLLIAGVAALILGIGLAFLADYMDYSVRSPEYLEDVLGLPPLAVLGVVGGMPGKGKRRRKQGAPGPSTPNGAPNGTVAPNLMGHNLVTLERPKSPDSETFRVLRTNIQFASLDAPIRSLVVTSVGPKEGKSFTAANLAIVMAQAGKRVILVDTDLRRPSIHKLFDLPNTFGFTNLILRMTPTTDGLFQTVPGVPNLSIITSGPFPPNPSELLNAQHTANVMAKLAQHADVVIYDAPPAAAVTDPVILAARVDAVVLVINAGMTRRDTLLRVKQNLKAVGVKVLIPVLNRVKTRDMQGYYYEYYGYGSLPQPPAPEAPEIHTNGNGKTPDAAELVSSNGAFHRSRLH